MTEMVSGPILTPVMIISLWITGRVIRRHDETGDKLQRRRELGKKGPLNGYDKTEDHSLESSIPLQAKWLSNDGETAMNIQVGFNVLE
jgi:hypothetical protein